MMTITTRFSNDEELESTFSNHQTYPDYIMNRTSRSNTNYSSPFTDISEGRRSESVPISPIHPSDYQESIEVAQMELELQFKTFEMLALIKGTTPQLAFEAERQQEIRSLRGRSTDVEDCDTDCEGEYDTSVRHPLKAEEDEGEYLIGESYLDVDELADQMKTFTTLADDEDSDAEEDIFGMEL